MSSSTTPDSPNDPSQVVKYIVVGTLSVFIWDILTNLLSDYKLLFQSRIRLPTVIYFISRICCFIFLLSATLLRIRATLPTTCNGVDTAVDVSFAFTIIFTSLLFFIRTRAVFGHNLWIIAFFAGLWLAVLGSCLAFIIGLLRNDGWKPFCIRVHTKTYAAAAIIVPLINDTLVFIAITWRLSCNSYVRPSLKDGIKAWVLGDYLPMFSKALLQDGQAYYLTTITVNLVAVIMLFVPSVPDILGTVFPVPNVALMNIMACRVFRNTMLRIANLNPGEYNGGTSIPLPLRQVESGNNRPKQLGDASFNDHHDGIAITKTVERMT